MADVDASGAHQSGTGGAQGLGAVLRSRAYVRLLLLSALLGVPVSLASFAFISLEHELQHAVWESLPDALGMKAAPWWWPLLTLTLAGLLLAPIVTRMAGKGGHIPVQGLGGPPIGPKAVPGVVLAALVCLPLGVVLGPEAPLMGLGSGLALLALQYGSRYGKRHGEQGNDPQHAVVLGAAGSTAAISTIFGSPIVAVVMTLEAAGIGGPSLVALLLPCLLASGIGALVFTGFGNFTGLEIGALSLPSVPTAMAPDTGDFLWGIPLAVLIAVVVFCAHTLGRYVVAWTARRTALRTVACAIAAGVCITAYALVTGRTPEEAALSGQATLASLAGQPHAWPVAVLAALVLFKGVAWGICLGSLRGGPIFPGMLIGAALGIAFGGLPGFGMASGLAVGLAASCSANTRLPVTSTVLATLLLGKDARDAVPLMIIASVVALVTTELLRARFASPSASSTSSTSSTRPSAA
ncbi:chloride channel protein [Streptomyces maoxianensis]|uniref:Chloride channel protein n=1 Tax=Streptomyces maoxianensis TaxID=1459942 RepID=A0ABV9G1U4_9ACTN